MRREGAMRDTDKGRSYPLTGFSAANSSAWLELMRVRRHAFAAAVHFAGGVRLGRE